MASGVGYLITNAFQAVPDGEVFGDAPLGPLTWRLGDHVFAFSELVQGLVEFGVVLTVILVFQNRVRPR